jgi:hypothetical protein
MPEAVDTVIATARDFLGERITTNATLREHHSHGQDTQPPVLPVEPLPASGPSQFTGQPVSTGGQP